MENNNEIMTSINSSDKKVAENDSLNIQISPSSKTMRVLSIDEYLEHVGQLGCYQAIIMIVCSFLFFVPAHQSLVMVFVAHSPPWVCQSTHNNNTTSACTTSMFHYEGQPGFNTRCDYARSEWKYTLPTSHSIVSEVFTYLFFLFLIDIRESLLFCLNLGPRPQGYIFLSFL